MLPEIEPLIRAPYFDTYLEHVESKDMQSELQRSLNYAVDLIKNLDEQQLNYRYAPGKWTIRQIILHLVDTELVFNYRALKIGREETSQVLAGFDENAYAEAANVSTLSRTELIELLKSIRHYTMLLYKTFSEEQLLRIGIASGLRTQVKSLFYISSGHTLHHCKVIEERYLS